MLKNIFFLSSYAPVFFLLSFQVNDDKYPWIRYLLIALTLVGLLGLGVILGLTRSKPTVEVEISDRRDAGAESVSFLAGYLLPLITASVDSAYVFWATTTYFVLAWVITVRTNLIQVNPLLLILGFHVVLVEFTGTSTSASRYLITKTPVRRGDVIKIHTISNNVYLKQKN